MTAEQLGRLEVTVATLGVGWYAANVLGWSLLPTLLAGLAAYLTARLVWRRR